MNRWIWLTVLAISATCVTPRFLNAQGRSHQSGGWGGVDLLLDPRVQQELSLDPDQIKKTRELSDNLIERQTVFYGRLEGLSGEARTRTSRELAVEHAADGIKAVRALLKPDQFIRFLQLDLQQRGASALLDPSTAQTLGITERQADQIRPVLDHSILRMREALATTRGDRRTSAEKIQLIRQETNKMALGLLTDAQKTRWNELTGPAFDLGLMVRSGR
jgi:hypothetical protein